MSTWLVLATMSAGWRGTTRESDPLLQHGVVIGSGEYIGGLVGQSYGTLTQSYSTAVVSGNTYVGGLVGTTVVL